MKITWTDRRVNCCVGQNKREETCRRLVTFTKYTDTATVCSNLLCSHGVRCQARRLCGYCSFPALPAWHIVEVRPVSSRAGRRWIASKEFWECMERCKRERRLGRGDGAYIQLLPTITDTAVPPQFLSVSPALQQWQHFHAPSSVSFRAWRIPPPKKKKNTHTQTINCWRHFLGFPLRHADTDTARIATWSDRNCGTRIRMQVNTATDSYRKRFSPYPYPFPRPRACGYTSTWISAFGEKNTRPFLVSAP